MDNNPMTPTCWIVTEGIAGTENQCLGVAEALGVSPVIKRIALRQPWKALSPWLGNESDKSFLPLGDRLAPPWPDLVIASGRKAIAGARYIRRMSGGKSFVVFLQDPRVPPSQFDLVAMPAHDRPAGRDKKDGNRDNVIITAAAPNRITPQRLNAAREEFAHAFADLPAPRIAVLIGGSSKAYKMTEDTTRRLATQLLDIVDDGDYSVMITTSRRTGAPNQKIIDDILLDSDAWIWDGISDNPYFGFLAWADIIMVTADSVSMMSEAATTGKPVYMIPLEGSSPRITRFHDNMIAHGAMRVFDGTVERWTYPPLDDAQKVAAEIKKRMKNGFWD